MDLNLSGLNLGTIVQSTLTPVADLVTVVRTGTVDQIASFLRGNPDQRGAVETALAANGRTGDLSSVVERATTPATTLPSTIGRTVSDVAGGVGRVIDAVTRPLDALARSTDPGALARPGQGAGHAGASDIAARVGTVATDVVAGAARIVGDVAGRAGAVGGDVAGRIAVASNDAARAPVDAGRALLSEAMRGTIAPARAATDAPVLASTARPGASMDGLSMSRAAVLIAAAMRDGQLANLVGTAMKEGRLVELVADARATGRLGDLAVAAKSIDGVLAAFATKGGLSATELALFARSGLFSQSDVHALRAAGVPVDIDEPLTQIAPRDGTATERLETEATVTDGVAVAGFADPSLASFDAGAIRIGSWSAFETYGVLGPPGSAVIAADSFEGVVRDTGGDLDAIERRLGLEAGVLADPDSFIALIDRRDLIGLRLAETLSAWLPGGMLPSALADLARATPFREVTLSA